MLERFYTDMCGSVGIGRAAAWFAHLPGIGAPFQRLNNRRLPSSIISRTRTFDFLSLQATAVTRRLNGDPEAAFRFRLKHSTRIGKAMARAGFGDATHVYSMLGEGGPFLAEAKRRGLSVVSEVFILLSTERILAAERKRFADWEPDVPDYEVLRRELASEDALLSYSDFFVCPSEAVCDDLVANWGVERSRTMVVPYGVNPEWLQTTPRPIRGRVLFVGTAELRKGIHYFAKAAEDLKSRGFAYDFRVAGSVTSRIAQRSDTRHLTFLGRVPRHKIGEEFSAADVFVLPSLAEGSAEVTFEALANGLPVVTTAAAGSVVRHGIDGLIVPDRDPLALAEAIVRIVKDRRLRERMSAAARSHAREYTWDRYGERLVAALKELD
jgi:glycosyltransferase involved in cell wall biosynthesis